LLLVVVVGKQTLSFVIEIKLSWWMFANKFYYLKLSRKWFPKAFNFLFCIVSEVLKMILLVFASE